MYLPSHFREERPEVLAGLIARHPLAALITVGPEGIDANHLPLLYSSGTLRGHLARGNPQWKNFRTDVEALAIFQGPDAYVSPNWYPTKAIDGRAVPTWNYAVVHAWGRLTVYSEPARLRSFLDELTAVHESQQAQPWQPADAPPQYIEGLLKAIVGIELTVTRIEGKWKTSQNQPAENRHGAAAALHEMARLIEPG